jgi:hypothetical protein
MIQPYRYASTNIWHRLLCEPKRDKRRCSAALGMTSAASSLTSPNMRASHLEDFYQFLRFPSVSTDDQYAEKVTECGHWLVGKTHQDRVVRETLPNAWSSGGLGSKRTQTRPSHRLDLWPLRCAAARSRPALGFAPFRTSFEKWLRLRSRRDG